MTAFSMRYVLRTVCCTEIYSIVAFIIMIIASHGLCYTGTYKYDPLGSLVHETTPHWK